MRVLLVHPSGLMCAEPFLRRTELAREFTRFTPEAVGSESQQG